GAEDRPTLDEVPVGDDEQDRRQDRGQLDREVIRTGDVLPGAEDRRRDAAADRRATEADEDREPYRHRVGPRHSPAGERAEDEAGDEQEQDRGQHAGDPNPRSGRQLSGPGSERITSGGTGRDEQLPEGRRRPRARRSGRRSVSSQTLPRRP